MRVATALARLFPIPMFAIAVASCGSGSPDGPGGLPVLKNAIVFVSDRSGEPQIYVMNADGTNPRAITNFPGRKYSPDVSSDGTHIVFSADGDSVKPSIFVINSDGTGLTQLITKPGSYYAPVWSGTGDRIAYITYPANDLPDIFVMNSDGGGQTNITNYPQPDDHPSWAPHRDLILFESSRAPPGRAPAQIYVTTPSGSSIRLVTTGVQSRIRCPQVFSPLVARRIDDRV